MRTVQLVIACIFLFVVLSSASGQHTSGSRARAEAAIRAADAAALKAAQAKDIAGATANYVDNASWLPPHAPIVEGKEAIRSAWAQFLAIPGLNMDWQITKIDVSAAGDMAYTLYKYEMTMSGPNGEPIHDKGKDIAVWSKQSDGAWKIVADTFNSDIPLPSVSGK